MELFSGHFLAKRIKSEKTIRKLFWLQSVRGAKLQLLKFGEKGQNFKMSCLKETLPFLFLPFASSPSHIFSLFCPLLLVFFAEHLPGFISGGKFSLKIMKYNFQGSILWMGGGTKCSLWQLSCLSRLFLYFWIILMWVWFSHINCQILTLWGSNKSFARNPGVWNSLS